MNTRPDRMSGFVHRVADVKIDGDPVPDESDPTGEPGEYTMENDDAWHCLNELVYDARQLLHNIEQHVTTDPGPPGGGCGISDREHLYRLLGGDVDMLAHDLEVAACRYLDHAEQLVARQPDGLLTGIGAGQMAAGHQQSAHRCTRVADRIRRLVAPSADDHP
jgi:hypothetical protein